MLLFSDRMMIPTRTIIVLVLFGYYISSVVVSSSSSSASMGSTETIIGLVGHDFVMIASDTTISGSSGGIALLKSSNVDKIHILNNIYPYQNTKIHTNIINSLQHHTKQQQLGRQQQQQQQQPIIAVSAIGNYADSDRLLNWLQSYTNMIEYQATNVGCDVEYIDCYSAGAAIGTQSSSSSSLLLSNKNKYKYKSSSMLLSVEDVANIVRYQISNSLRSRSHLNICLLIGGMMIIGRQSKIEQRQQQKDLHTVDDDNNDSKTDTFRKTNLYQYPSSTVQEQLAKIKHLSDNDNSSRSSSSSSLINSISTNSDKSLNSVHDEISDSTYSTDILNDPLQSQSVESHEGPVTAEVEQNEIVTTLIPTQDSSNQEEVNDEEEQTDTSIWSSQKHNKNVDCNNDNDNNNNNMMKMKPILFWLDEYGSIQQVPYGAHGLGSMLIISILDQEYTTSISRDDAVRLLQKCFQQLQERYVINTRYTTTTTTTSSSPSILIKCIDQYGCHTILQ